MHDQSSIESSLAVNTNSDFQYDTCDYDTDCESTESSQGCCFKSLIRNDQSDTSIESPWCFLEDDLDHLSASSESEDEKEENEEIGNQCIHSMSTMVHELRCTTTGQMASKSRIFDGRREPENMMGVIVSMRMTNKEILCEMDSSSFNQLLPRKRDDCLLMHEQQQSKIKNSLNRLHHHWVPKKHFPQFAVSIEWDKEMLHRYVSEHDIDSSSAES